MHSRTVNSGLSHKAVIDFHRASVKEGGSVVRSPGDRAAGVAVSNFRADGRRPNETLVQRFPNVMKTMLITSAFVPGLFLRRIVGPSAIFILPVVAPDSRVHQHPQFGEAERRETSTAVGRQHAHSDAYSDVRSRR